MEIARAHFDEVIAHAQADAPHECCGFMSLNGGRVNEVFRAENIKHSPYGYEFGFKALVRANELEDEGLAFACDQAESCVVQNILPGEGSPSGARRARGFDVPDFLAAGPRDVLVPASGVELARALLREADVAETVEPAPPVTLQWKVVLAVLGGGLLAALVAWLLAGSGSP